MIELAVFGVLGLSGGSALIIFLGTAAADISHRWRR